MIILVDGNNLAHRIFHTPAGNLTTKQGEPSGVMLGVLKSCRELLNKFPEATKLIVAWDGGRSEWRKALYPDYKAQRSYGDDEEEKEKYAGLFNQMEQSHNMLHMLGIHSIKISGQEADDIIAGIVAYNNGTAFREHVMVVSSDKDMLQLISDDASVYSPYKDKIISKSNFYEETGVTLHAYVGYRALVGDTSDNIIGIKGIGDKTAKGLMDEFGHIDNVLNSTGDARKKLMKSKVKSRIFEQEGLQKLAINNKIMNLNLVPYSEEMAEGIKQCMETELPYKAKEFREWLVRWQYASVLSDYKSFVFPFYGIAE